MTAFPIWRICCHRRHCRHSFLSKSVGSCRCVLFCIRCLVAEKLPKKIGQAFWSLHSVYFECISLLYKVFAMLQKQTYLPEKQYKKIKPAIDYINENFTNGKLSVGKLSAICGISESALKKLFIKKFGVPPVRYIIQLKINYSCDLLRSGLYSVSRVSQICGYGNVYFFSRQFKENMGISPSEFIKKYKSSK